VQYGKNMKSEIVVMSLDIQKKCDGGDSGRLSLLNK
jgi:hypothetical protein